MKTELLWTDKVPEKDPSTGAPSDTRSNVVYDMAFKPDGSHVLVAVGSRIVVYDCEDGMVQHTLRAHKDSVYCLAYSRDGKFFASGSADKNVIIWKDNLEGILKYSHNESIQCLAYNPVTGQLASGSTSDFGLWSPEQKNVQKFKVSAKVLCAAWTNDGQHLALGQLNGHVSIRDKLGNEKARIERSEPIWTLQFSPAPGGREALGGGSAAVVSADGKGDSSTFRETLAVGCWDKTLSFYGISGVQIGKDKPLDFDPCSLAFFSPLQAGAGSEEASTHCDYIAAGGSDRKVSLFSRDGQLLKEICGRDDWVWCVRARPKAKQLIVGCNDGSVSMYQITFNTVHGLYRDRYAYRDSLTELVVQHLLSDRKTRIKCKDYIKKIAVYRDRLAVQLPDRVLIYEDSEAEDPMDMHYKLKEKIMKKLECNLLVVTSQHLMLCTDKKLQLLDFKGNKVREWVLDAAIRYIRVVGGPSGREGLLVGLKNGGVFKIFVDNGFPVPLIKHDVGIRCLDLSSTRRKLAVVDEQQRVLVYDLMTQQVLFQEFNANSVAWNTELEDMLCYSGAGQLCIKTGDFPVHRQPLQGFVVGFNGAKIFCLHFLSMQTIDVPQSASLARYIERKDFENAYRVACLGVTDSDWRELAFSSLQHLSLEVARKALIRVRDVRFLELLQRVEVARRAAGGSGLSTANELALVAEVLAYQGMFPQAAQLWVRAGKAKQAVEMFLDLRDWERAKGLVEQVAAREEGKAEGMNDLNMLQLMERQADWLLENGDKKGAAELYWGSKKLLKAVNILGESGFAEELAAKVRQLNKLQRTELEAAAVFLRKLGKLEFACEAMLKLEDYKGLLALYVESGQWEAAFQLVDLHPEPSLNLASLIYSPYADYLASKGDYIGAQQALVRAGRPQESLRMQQSLCANAVSERRFQDAGYHTWLVAAEHRKLHNELALRAGQADPATLSQLATDLAAHASAFVEALATAELLFAYHLIHRYTDEPFTALQPETIFQTALYILNRTAAPSAPAPSALEDGAGVPAGPKQAAIELPEGVSRSQCLYALAKQAHSLGAFRLARQAYDRLLNLRLPNAWRDQIECAWLAVRARPYSDREELQTVCYRCSSPNPLMAAPLDRCVNCGHPFIRSFCSFETLPLVEFTVADDISEEEALQLIDTEPAASAQQPRRREHQSDDGAVQTLRFDDDDPSEHEDEKGPAAPQDQFQQQLMVVDPDSSGSIPPIRLDRSGLLACPRKEVFVRRSGFDGAGTLGPRALPFRSVQYFRSVLPEIPIHLCGACGHFFHLEDFEFHVLQKHACPFCRVAVPDDF